MICTPGELTFPFKTPLCLPSRVSSKPVSVSTLGGGGLVSSDTTRIGFPWRIGNPLLRYGMVPVNILVNVLVIVLVIVLAPTGKSLRNFWFWMLAY